MPVLRATATTLLLFVTLVPAAEAMATLSYIEVSGLGTSASCVVMPGGSKQVSCRACVGPGETEEFPVESQGGGVAVGVPREPGTYAEQDVVGGKAGCG
jgi:hypothetical protein